MINRQNYLSDFTHNGIIPSIKYNVEQTTYTAIPYSFQYNEFVPQRIVLINLIT